MLGRRWTLPLEVPTPPSIRCKLDVTAALEELNIRGRSVGSMRVSRKLSVRRKPRSNYSQLFLTSIGDSSKKVSDLDTEFKEEIQTNLEQRD